MHYEQGWSLPSIVPLLHQYLPLQWELSSWQIVVTLVPTLLDSELLEGRDYFLLVLTFCQLVTQQQKEVFSLPVRWLQWGPPHSFADLLGFVRSNKNFKRQLSVTVILQSLISFTGYQWFYSLELFSITQVSPVLNKICISTAVSALGGHQDNKRLGGDVSWPALNYVVILLPVTQSSPRKIPGPTPRQLHSLTTHHGSLKVKNPGKVEEQSEQSK